MSFRYTYTFHADGTQIASDSTLIFCSRRQIENSLHEAGYTVCDIRDALDRPGLDRLPT